MVVLLGFLALFPSFFVPSVSFMCLHSLELLHLYLLVIFTCPHHSLSLMQVRQLFDALGGLFKPDSTVAPQHKAQADACRGALKMVRQYERGFFWDTAYAASCVDALAADPMAGKVRGMMGMMLYYICAYTVMQSVMNQ